MKIRDSYRLAYHNMIEVPFFFKCTTFPSFIVSFKIYKNICSLYSSWNLGTMKNASQLHYNRRMLKFPNVGKSLREFRVWSKVKGSLSPYGSSMKIRLTNFHSHSLPREYRLV